MRDTSSIPGIETIMEHLGGSVFCCENDAELTIVHAQSFFYKILGYGVGEIKALYSREIWKDSGVSRCDLQEKLDQSGFLQARLRLKQKDGKPVWLGCMMKRIFGTGNPELICGIFFDLTGRLDAAAPGEEEKTGAAAGPAAREQRYRLLMEESADPIFDYDFVKREVYCSPSFLRKLSFNVQGGGYLRQLRETDFIFEADRKRALRDVAETLKGGGKKHREYRLKTTEGVYHWFRVRNSILFRQDGRPERVSLFFTDIDKQKKETLQLKERAERDLLTGLYNHVTTSSLIDQAIFSSRSDAVHVLFLLDIDNFKTINDHMGHLIGDIAVEELGIRLKEQFREDDIVGRTGGDEFVVFLQNIPSEQVLFQKARILNELFRTTRIGDKSDYQITCSVGIAVYPRDGRDFHELFQKADAAMYAAKRSGKDHFCVYDAVMNGENGMPPGMLRS